MKYNKWNQADLDLVTSGMSIEDIVTKTGRSYESVARVARRNGIHKQEKQVIPKVLVFDVETSPLLVYTFGIFEQNIQPNQIKDDWYMLCWSAKWLMSPKVMHDRLTGKESTKKNDKRIVQALWSLLDEAQLVVGHNIDQFDLKKVNSKFIEYGLGLPSPYQTIDTLKVVRSVAGFTSNKLDYLMGKLHKKQKLDTGGLPLWIAAKNGDEDALKKMDKYCQNDTAITEDMYLYLRPYCKSHPNLGLYLETDKEVCPNCGSNKIKWDGYYYSPVNKFRSGRCECGANVRRKVSELPKEKRKLLLK